MRMAPPLGSMSPATILSSVDLPQPDGPSKQTNSLSAMLTEMDDSATISPSSTSYRLESAWISTTTRLLLHLLPARVPGIAVLQREIRHLLVGDGLVDELVLR